MELQIQHLSKTYANGVKALDDVTLTIPRGMFGLLGPNGAGKSTLMRTIATLQEADGGSIRLGELDVLQDKMEVRRRLGYLPQEFGVYPKISAYDMLDEPAEGKKFGKPIEIRKSRMREKENTFVFITKEKPAQAGIDPYYYLVDRMPDDNLKKVEAN